MKASTILGGSLLAAGTIILGYFVEQETFGRIALGFLLSLAGYFLLMQPRARLTMRAGLTLAILLRVVLIPAFPILSDDVYRFYWDGQLLLAGINPYTVLPIVLEANTIQHQATILSELNSPAYYSVYPPVAQLFFGITALLSGSSVYGFAIVLSAIFLLFEWGTMSLGMKFLKNIGLPVHHILLYALHPLVIIEGVGNLHFEIVMIFFVILGLLPIYHKKHFQGICSIFLSILTKLTSAILWPFLIAAMRPRRWACVSAMLLLIALGIAVGFSDSVYSIIDSLDLYFRTFEFNGSLYNVARWLGFQWKGYNLIGVVGPALAVGSMLLISLLIWRARSLKLPNVLQHVTISLIIYYLFATTVHPWYIILPLFMGIFTRLVTPWVWASVIWLSYSHYGASTSLSSALIVIEYAVVFTALYYDFRRTRALC